MASKRKRQWGWGGSAGICFVGAGILFASDGPFSASAMDSGRSPAVTKSGYDGGRALPAPPAKDKEKPPEKVADAEESEEGPPLRTLTPEEINRIRFLELRAFRNPEAPLPERVQVKISRGTIESFLNKDLKETPEYKDLQGDPDADEKLAKEIQEFRRMTPPEKLQFLVKYSGTRYIDEVKIQNDPEIFANFKKWVMPQVLKTCATAECHSSANSKAPAFRLYAEARNSPDKMYANFIVLSEASVVERPDLRGGPLIDRDYPAESLLLKYLLDPKQVAERDRHPGDVKYRSAFKSEGPLAYKRINQWISELRHPSEDYGVYILKKPPVKEDAEPSAATKPAGKDPKKDKHKTDKAKAQDDVDEKQ